MMYQVPDTLLGKSKMTSELMTRREWADINKSVIRSSSMEGGANLLEYVYRSISSKPTIFWCDNLELPIYKAEVNGCGCYIISTPTGHIPYSTDLEAYKKYMTK